MKKKRIKVDRVSSFGFLNISLLHNISLISFHQNVVYYFLFASLKKIQCVKVNIHNYIIFES
jgi:hypothetical protein